MCLDPGIGTQEVVMYLDPGLGGLLLQFLIGGIAGASVAMGVYRRVLWTKIRQLRAKLRNK